MTAVGISGRSVILLVTVSASVHLATLGIHESVEKVFDPDRLREELTGLGVDIVQVEDPGRNRGPRSTHATCDGIVTLRHRKAFLDADLEWLHAASVGVDHYPLERYCQQGTVVTNSPGVNSDAVAETAIGLLFTLVRTLDRSIRLQETHEWLPPDPADPFLVRESTVCVVGLGSVGQRVATRAAALGMDVIGVRRNDEPIDGVRRIYDPEDLEGAIETARFVVIAVPLTAETSELISEDELRSMDEDAYLVNVARGGIVDQAALLEALETDTIAGAALDTFAEEPLSPDSPLWEQENAIVLPHIAGLHEGYVVEIADVVEDTIRKLQQGAIPPNQVN